MGKKNKGRAKQVVVSAAQDLSSFAQGGRPGSPKNMAAAEQVSSGGAQDGAGPQDAITCESRLKEMVQRIRRDEGRQGIKDLSDHFLYLDNKLIELYCDRCDETSVSQQERPEVLEDDAFLHFTRKLNQELEYILALPFVNFWAEVTKDSQVIDFLDAFLLNVRKKNDVYKLQAGVIDALGAGSRQSSMHLDATIEDDGGVQTSKKRVKTQMNRLIKVVLKMFYRLSKPVESDSAYFPINVYQGLIYNNWIFDIAKLYDIIAVYGNSNTVLVKSMIESVFENDKRYVQDFKDGVDTIIGMLKKNFSSSLKVSDMINQAGVIQRTRSEQDDIIRRLMLDIVEIMSNVELTTTFFPEAMLETVRSTSLPLFMANVYCLMAGPVKTQWMQESYIGAELNRLRKQVQKVAIDTCLTLLDVAIVRCINVHSQHYAVVQNTLAGNLKQFVLGVTGNVELSKEFLHRNSNFMASSEQNKAGCRFLKKILYKRDERDDLRVNFVQAIQDFEERFMSVEDKTFLIRILKSLARGNLVQVKRVAPPTTMPTDTNNSNNNTSGSQPAKQEQKLSQQDKDNIKNVLDMFGEKYERAYVQKVYLMNNKDFELTLDMFLTENLPEVDAKPQLTMIETAQERKGGSGDGNFMINTNFQEPQKQIQTTTGNGGSNNMDMRSYVLDEYKDVLFPKKLQKYEKAHAESVAREKIRDEQDTKEVRKKILELAQMMQYDDDHEESAVSQKRHPQKTASREPQQEQRKVVKKPEETKKSTSEALVDGDSDDEDDYLNDDPMAFIERQDSQQTDMNNLFEDDPKAKRINKVRGREANESQQKSAAAATAASSTSENNRARNNQPKNNKNEESKGRDNQGRGRGRGADNEAARDSNQQRGGRGAGGNDNRGRGGKDNNNSQQQRQNQQKENRRGGRDGAPRDGGPGRGRGGRGGYSDDYQREQLDQDNDYTSKNPLEQNDNDSDNEDGQQAQGQSGRGRGRGGRGRGDGQNRGGGDSRGGRGRGGRGRGGKTSTRDPHNQRNAAAKKQA